MNREARFTIRRPYELRGERGSPREILTPEGVPLVFRVAPAGDRLGAFVLDLVYQLLALLALGALLFGLAFDAGGLGTDVAVAFGLFLVFVVQNLYFILFEARTRGQTPGKRQLGIRVMDARGGPLTTDAVIVRNVMRTLEFWLPAAVILRPGALFPGAPGWAIPLGLLWMVAVSGLPLFNRWRLRAGDLVAGTLVVVAPRALLLGDLGGRAVEKRARQDEEFPFTPAQLDAYGIYELQVLEEVLRREGVSVENERTLRAVAHRIARKIDWPDEVPPARTRAFLQQYYAALRLRLEQRMLFGRRKEDKHDV